MAARKFLPRASTTRPQFAATQTLHTFDDGEVAVSTPSLPAPLWNHPGHPDQSSHGRRGGRRGPNLPSAPNAPDGDKFGPMPERRQKGGGLRPSRFPHHRDDRSAPTEQTVKLPSFHGMEPDEADEWLSNLSKADWAKMTSGQRRRVRALESDVLEHKRGARNSLDALDAGDESWFSIKASGDTAQVHIYNAIGEGGITAERFKADLDGLTAKSIELRINSIGGDVYDGITIHNAIREHPAQVSIVVDGVAASIASVIAMAGDTVTMSRGSQMMIHDAFTGAVGNAAHMRSQAEVLDRFSDTIAGFYADKAGGPVEHWRERMRAETWYDAEEAVKAGLADHVQASSRTVRAAFSVAALGCFKFAGRDKAPPPVLAYMVAEPGPEIVDLPLQSTVIPAPRAATTAATSTTSRPAGTTKTAASADWASMTGPLLNSPATGADELLASLRRQ